MTVPLRYARDEQIMSNLYALMQVVKSNSLVQYSADMLYSQCPKGKQRKIPRSVSKCHRDFNITV